MIYGEAVDSQYGWTNIRFYQTGNVPKMEVTYKGLNLDGTKVNDNYVITIEQVKDLKTPHSQKDTWAILNKLNFVGNKILSQLQARTDSNHASMNME